MIKTPRGAVDCSVSGEGPPVLVLHGAMGGHDQGELLARAALGRIPHRSIAVSRPGYLATPLALGATPEEQADLCAAVLDALAIPNVAVIAISGGGQCALQFALRHPKRCSALVMISACSAPLAGRVPWRFRFLRRMARFPRLLDRLRKRADRDPERAARRSIPDLAMRLRTLGNQEAGPLLREWQVRALDSISARLPGTRNDIRQSHRAFAYPLEQIAAPLLVVHGTRDAEVPFTQAQALATAVPGAELLAIEGAGHAALFTHLRQIRLGVGRFLTS